MGKRQMHTSVWGVESLVVILLVSVGADILYHLKLKPKTWNYFSDERI